MRMLPAFVGLALSLNLFSVSSFAQNPNSIVNSKHNLSVSSPGTVHATTESEICVFCHTPHNAMNEGPLWNHSLSSQTYVPYSSATLKAAVGQPTGSSRLCLGCHDGTVALGSVHSGGNIAMNSATMPAGPGNVGIDLSADHPVSFVYDSALVTADGNLREPNTLPTDVRLDRAGEMQCSSCHDPHNNQYGSFLVMDNTGSALCLTCHNVASWSGGAHAMSAQPLPAVLTAAQKTSAGGRVAKAAKKSTVAGEGCGSCHVPHSAGSDQRLLRFAEPEKNCLTCHSSDGPGKNISTDLSKFSAHFDQAAAETHKPNEDAINPPTRHATCADCHNAHASTATVGSATKLSGALNGVAGVSAAGGSVRAITHEYELCFRCHGDSDKRGVAVVPRQAVETNVRREFNPGNGSFHPIEAIGKNSSSPSLILPMTASSLITCTDCHNNNSGPGAGGTGAKGPHGSIYSPLLERNLLVTDGQGYNAANFALCYKCHSSTIVDSSSSSSWRYHRKHIEEFKAACTTCHDSHASGQPHLINFNTAYVKPVNGVLRYTSTGVNHGTCTLTCHDGSGQNKNHNPKSY